MANHKYPVVISPLSDEDGGGFIAYVPDLPGCMSDGDTPEDTLHNAYDAIKAWLEAANDLGRDIPAPSQKLAFASSRNDKMTLIRIKFPAGLLLGTFARISRPFIARRQLGAERRAGLQSVEA